MKNELVLLKTFNNSIEANIVKGFLESNEIMTVIFDENTISINPILTTALGGIKLLVNQSDYSKAIQLINETNENYEKEELNLNCPKCGSKEIKIKYKHNWFALFMMLISFSFTPNSGNFKIYHCNKCKNEWNDSVN